MVFVRRHDLAILLPARVDSSQGEGTMELLRRRGQATRRRAPASGIPPAVAFALRANCGPRWLSGFLTMFMAFLLRENPIDGWSTELLLGLVIGAAGLGNTLGIALASLLKRINPAVTVVVALLADAAVVAGRRAVLRLLPLVLLGLVGRARPGAGQALARRDDPARRARAGAGQRLRPLATPCSSWPG